MRHLLLSILAISIVGVLMCPTASSQEVIVPNWIKNNASWWASDQIPDSAFLQGIQFLIKEGIIIIPFTETSESPQSQEVPTWIKNTAGWWAENKISETEFVNAIEFLIKHGIIIVNNSSSCVNDLSEILDDSNTAVQDICDLHESSKHSELLPFVREPNFNSHGFRGDEFSEIKPPNTYRIFMVGGSTLFGSGESSDDATIPSILQKIFDSDNSIIQKIEVINAGFGGANTKSEFELLVDLNKFQPDLVIVYDGWNDLRADFSVEYTKEAWELTCQAAKASNFDVIVARNVNFDELKQGRYLLFGSPPPIDAFANFVEGEGQVMLVAKEDHPVMRFVRFEDIVVTEGHHVVTDTNVETLLEGSGWPAVHHYKGKGIQIVYVAFDPLNSNWPYLRSFPFFVFNAVQYLGRIGDPLTEMLKHIGQSITHEVEIGTKTVTIEEPDGRKHVVIVDPHGQVSWGPIQLTGLHDITWGDGNLRVIAINCPSEESMISTVKNISIGATTIESSDRGGRSFIQLWPWALGLVLLVLLAEWWVYQQKVGGRGRNDQFVVWDIPKKSGTT